MLRVGPLTLAFVLCLTAVAGCFSSPQAPPTDDTDGVPTGLTPVRERYQLPFQTEHVSAYVGGQIYSAVLEPGPFKIQLPGQSVFVDAAVPLGNGLPTQRVHLGLFLPDVPEGTKVPVIADAGPYYGEPLLGDVHATEPAHRLGAFLIENFVPHGYAVAQVSVLGTGDSGGCMDLMGPVEQAGVQAAVEWLGTQEWSNGNVALIGRSYDGSTPWEAAMAGSEHLKTVIPISGLWGQHALMWRNGSAETRGPGVLWGLYYAFTYTGNEGNPDLQAMQVAENAICPDTQTGGVQGVAAYLTGDRVAPQVNAYWREREFREEVLAEYNGSVYFIHGLQDWNVDPHMAFPFYQELEARGLDMKGLFGQWGHMYPDRPGEHGGLSAYPESVRYDWAQDLLEWFNHYLKGTGPQPELHVEVQDDHGAWRIEATWPPEDFAWRELKLASDFERVDSGDDLVAPSAPLTPEEPLVFRTEPLEASLRLAGLAQFHVAVTPTGPGGQLYAELRDADDNTRIGHAIMDLRFAQGGRDAQPVVPGQRIVAKMEFFAIDGVVPAGHRLELHVAHVGRDYLPSPVSSPVMVHVEDASVLRLPAIERGPTAFFAPPGVEPATPVM